MKIVNQTHWRTDQIRAIVARVAQDELEVETRKRLVVTVVYRRRSRSTSHAGGHATVGEKGVWAGSRMTLSLPSITPDPIAVAKVTAHEMAHLRGLRHREMRCARYSYQVEGWREFYAWAAAYTIERKAPPPKPTVTERQQRKLDHARGMLVRWERASKRATTKVKRWRGRVRDLERYVQMYQAAEARAPFDNELASSKL